MLTASAKLHDLSVSQLKHAVEGKQRIAAPNKELRGD